MRVGPTGHADGGEESHREPVGMEVLPAQGLPYTRTDSSGVFSPAHSMLPGGGRTMVSGFSGVEHIPGKGLSL